MNQRRFGDVNFQGRVVDSDHVFQTLEGRGSKQFKSQFKTQAQVRQWLSEVDGLSAQQIADRYGYSDETARGMLKIAQSVVPGFRRTPGRKGGNYGGQV